MVTSYSSGSRSIAAAWVLGLAGCAAAESGAPVDAAPPADAAEATTVDAEPGSARIVEVDPGPLNAEPFAVAAPVCRADGWCWHWPYPVGATIYDTATLADGTVRMVGGGGTVVDLPVRGTPMLRGARGADDANFWSVWVSPVGETWLAGQAADPDDRAGIWRMAADGRFDRQVLPEALADGYLYRVAGRQSDVLAIGQKGTGDRGSCLGYRRLGSSWYKLTPPCTGHGLFDVAFSDTGEAWLTQGTDKLLVMDPNGTWRAVTVAGHAWLRLWWRGKSLYLYGADGTVAELTAAGALVQRGTLPAIPADTGINQPPCLPMLLEPDGRLVGVAESTNAGSIGLFAVGADGAVEQASFSLPDRTVRAVAPAAGGYWLLGDSGLMLEAATASGTIVERSRRPAWAANDAFVRLWSMGGEVIGVSGSHVPSVGQGFVIRWTGASWAPLTSVPGHGGAPNAVWADDECLYVAKEDGLFRWDRTRWETWPDQHFEGDSEVRSITGRGCADVYALRWGNVIEHWDGSEWTRLPASPGVEPLSVNSLWVSPVEPDGPLYIAAKGVFRYADGSWSTELGDGPASGFTSIWGIPGAGPDTLVIGESGSSSRVRIDGGWTSWSLPGEDTFSVYGARGLTPDTLLAMSDRGLLVPGTGGWRRLSSPWGSGIAWGAWVTPEGTIFLDAAWSDNRQQSSPTHGMLVWR